MGSRVGDDVLSFCEAECVLVVLVGFFSIDVRLPSKELHLSSCLCFCLFHA
jgi:hypothetical protein